MTIHESAKEGDLESVKELVAEDPDLVHETYENMGWGPLHFACFHNQPHVVAFLLDQGASINRPSSTQSGSIYPLHLACREGHLEVVKLLIDRGADITLHGAYGNTPLMEASNQGHVEVVRYLLDSHFPPTAIHQVNFKGETAIGLACHKRQVETVKMLLGAGADPLAPACKGGPPIALLATQTAPSCECLTFLAEWERAYFLAKVRSLYDWKKFMEDHQPQGDIQTLPAYLKGRVENGGVHALPRVELVPVVEEEGEIVKQVLEQSIRRLSGEVFPKLMRMMGKAGVSVQPYEAMDD